MLKTKTTRSILYSDSNGLAIDSNKYVLKQKKKRRNNTKPKSVSVNVKETSFSLILKKEKYRIRIWGEPKCEKEEKTTE